MNYGLVLENNNLMSFFETDMGIQMILLCVSILHAAGKLRIRYVG